MRCTLLLLTMAAAVGLAQGPSPSRGFVNRQLFRRDIFRIVSGGNGPRTAPPVRWAVMPVAAPKIDRTALFTPAKRHVDTRIIPPAKRER